MSKKTNETTETKQPDYVAELLLNGTVTLTANTREELAEMVDNIPAECHYGAGAVGKNPETGAFTLRVDITNP
jgi:hypothetical protein